MDLIDRQYLLTPFYGTRRMGAILGRKGYFVNRKRIQRLMKLMGIEAIYPKKNLSRRRHDHKVYPYLLRGLEIARPNQVWSTDITYIRLESGFVYLVAIIDWFSRYVLSWELSNTLMTDFCIEALNCAFKKDNRTPEIFNTDQGCQFTAESFVSAVESMGAKISMDGRGRALDNIFIERLWRSLKYEEVYLKSYRTPKEAYDGISRYFEFYNNQRPHQSLGYKYPCEVYYAE